MHPEVVRDTPGACPICGMALEPRSVTAEERNPELIDMSRRFWVSLALALPVFFLAMSEMSLRTTAGPGARHSHERDGWHRRRRDFRRPHQERRALETLEKVDTLVVDKTGTLTEGKPKLTVVVALDGDEAGLIRLASSLERASEHPLAASIVAGAKDRGVAMERTERFQSISGKGVTGVVGEQQVALGNLKLFEALGIDLGLLRERAEVMRGNGQTVMFVAVDQKAAGLLGVADVVKESAREAIRGLKAEGIRVVMLTGDSRTTAEAVARTLDLTEVIAELLPEQKGDVVRKLQTEGRTVAMADDGINDAPALAQAHVGIAKGTGTDVAMESAGVTLMKGDLRGILRARRLSRGTTRNIRQNLFFAFIYNTLGGPVAAGVRFPFFGVLLSPMLASASMSLSSVSVIANALRLRKLVL